jgi:DNA-directed RNA polymerase specialized sigma24 family protein
MRGCFNALLTSTREESIMEPHQAYAPALLRKAERTLMSQSAAQEVVHALFLALQQSGELQDDFAELSRALTHRCLDWLRDQDAPHAPEITLRGPVRTLCSADAIDVELLRELARTLDREHSEIAVYRYIDDMSQAEIAALLRQRPGAVGLCLERIRSALLERKRGGGA